MFQPNIRLANFLLAEYPDEYPAGWCLVILIYMENTNPSNVCVKISNFRPLEIAFPNVLET